jgi:benzoate-CoA ligase family protein
VLNITPEDRSFSASKLFFAYGLGNALYFPAGAGSETFLLRERATVERVFDVLEHYRPTLFYAVPSLYAAMAESAAAPRGLWSSVRCAVSAGEALPAALWHRFRERFDVEILDGIGSTEMLHIFISNRAGRVVPGSSGELVPGYEARVVNDEGCDAESGAMGNLWVRGESAAAGYWNRPELTREIFRESWVATGDKYRRDEGGYFWHCGRSDDMMKVHGLWVSPLEIESALVAHPAIVECAVVGASDETGLTGPRAFVVFKESVFPSPALLDDLHRHLAQCLPRYKVPRWLVPVEGLPKTATGKIQRFRLRQL